MSRWLHVINRTFSTYRSLPFNLLSAIAWIRSCFRGLFVGHGLGQGLMVRLSMICWKRVCSVPSICFRRQFDCFRRCFVFEGARWTCRDQYRRQKRPNSRFCRSGGRRWLSLGRLVLTDHSITPSHPDPNPQKSDGRARQSRRLEGKISESRRRRREGRCARFHQLFTGLSWTLSSAFGRARSSSFLVGSLMILFLLIISIRNWHLHWQLRPYCLWIALSCFLRFGRLRNFHFYEMRGSPDHAGSLVGWGFGCGGGRSLYFTIICALEYRKVLVGQADYSPDPANPD